MNTTYFFGAGASAEAIPIVNDATERFNFFIFYLRKIFDSNKDGIDEKLSGFIWDRLCDYEVTISNASKHLSYDTYAKKLWLKKDWIMLRRLKEFISLYYMFEQYEIEDKWQLVDWYVLSFDDQEDREDMRFSLLNKFNSHRDKRYDAFIAGVTKIINHNRFLLPNNMSIISWNYDLQVEFAFEEYYPFSRKLDSMFNPVFESQNGGKIIYVNDYIKLNGSCGYDLKGDEEVVGVNLTDLEILPLVDKFVDIKGYLFQRLLTYAENRNINMYKPFINFAWERNIISIAILERAKQVMRYTNSLVIIGYSFPLYNREVDKELFSNLKISTNSKIYIQTISKDEFEQVKTRLLGVYEIDESKIVFIQDVKQFYVPFEIDNDSN